MSDRTRSNSTSQQTGQSTRESASEPTGRIDGVLVVGGGYAGLRAARAAAQHLAKGSTSKGVTVLDQRDTHDFVTRLAGIAAGGDSADGASQPLSSFGHHVEIGRLAKIHDGAVDLTDGRTLTADAVIISAGARPTSPPIDGIEHALPLRSAAHALAIHDALSSADAVVIIGGGATGVQLAASVAHQHDAIDVHVVDGGPRLLSPMSAATGSGAQRILEGRGVQVHLDTEVDEITATGAVVDDEQIDGVVVWAGGFEARADELGVDVSGEGRILVRDDLRVAGMERTFAAGDIAAHLAGDGSFLPMSAQIAVQAGEAAGANAARLIAGEALEVPSLVQRGWVLDLGGRRGLAEFGPIELTAPFADLVPPVLHKLIDLKTLFGMGGLPALRW